MPTCFHATSLRHLLCLRVLSRSSRFFALTNKRRWVITPQHAHCKTIITTVIFLENNIFRSPFLTVLQLKQAHVRTYNYARAEGCRLFWWTLHNGFSVRRYQTRERNCRLPRFASQILLPFRAGMLLVKIFFLPPLPNALQLIPCHSTHRLYHGRSFHDIAMLSPTVTSGACSNHCWCSINIGVPWDAPKYCGSRSTSLNGVCGERFWLRWKTKKNKIKLHSQPIIPSSPVAMQSWIASGWPGLEGLRIFRKAC